MISVYGINCKSVFGIVEGSPVLHQTVSNIISHI